VLLLFYERASKLLANNVIIYILFHGKKLVLLHRDELFLYPKPIYIKRVIPITSIIKFEKDRK